MSEQVATDGDELLLPDGTVLDTERAMARGIEMIELARIEWEEAHRLRVA